MLANEKASERRSGVLQVKNMRAEFVPYTFHGFLQEESACYLRYEIKNGRCLILIAQLPEYFGTDITSGFKEIVKSVVVHLVDESVFKLTTPSTLVKYVENLMLPNKALKKLRDDTDLAAFDFVRNADWVACYPPGVGLIPGEAFALVRMDDELNYRFDYRRKDVIAEFLGIDTNNLNIDYSKLIGWKSNHR